MTTEGTPRPRPLSCDAYTRIARAPFPRVHIHAPYAWAGVLVPQSELQRQARFLHDEAEWNSQMYED